jgi:tryptophanyl-tRNA synthetase
MDRPVILTGLRANNDLHIGNYLGALLPIIDMAKNKSDEFDINLFVPDLHSFTTPVDHGSLQANILNNLKLYGAAGLPLDNPNVHIYRQSYVPAHSELTWILDCFTGMGEMNRMTQFKDKSASLSDERISLGLFNYPVLMAADMLLYNASYVPVGDDQSQHLEFTRDIAERMNNQFGELFAVPKSVKEQHEFFNKDQGLRIMDLADPTKKMSKSDDTGKGVIFLNDTIETARQKIMSATTDSLNNINYDKQNQPGLANLLELLSLLSEEPLDSIIERYKGQTQYGPLKNDLTDRVTQFLEKFQGGLSNVSETQLETKLKESEELMNSRANTTLLKVQKAVGLRS